MKKIEISSYDYNRIIMRKLDSGSNMPYEELLTSMLEEAAKYKIVDKPVKKRRK